MNSEAYVRIPIPDAPPEPEVAPLWVALYPLGALLLAIGFVVVLAVFGEFWFFLSIFVLLGLAIVGAACAAVTNLL